MTHTEQDMLVKQAEAAHLRKLNTWVWYIRGARDMLLRLRGRGFCEEPHNGDLIFKKGEYRIYVKAILDLLQSDKLNIDRFLTGEYDIGFTDHERDKKGKLIKCRAYFARKVVKYEGI